MAQTSSKIAKGRIVASIFLLAFIGVSFYFGISAWRWKLNFYEWVDAKPMQMTVDLTTPSTHIAPFTQTCVMAHGQSIYVAFDDPHANEENIGEYFAGLQGRVTIQDLGGVEILTKQFDAKDVRLWGDDPMLVGFHPFANGDYTIEIEIEQGASAIDGRRHELYARNELCGLELMPAYVLGATSAVATLIACVVGCYTIPSLARHGFHVQISDDVG